jgi:hypothetical protein
MSNESTVRPFSVEVAEEDLVELRRRIAAALVIQLRRVVQLDSDRLRFALIYRQ